MSIFKTENIQTSSIDIKSTAGTDVFNIGATNADIINIGNATSVINILGTAIYEYAANRYVLDKLITLNYNSAAGSGVGVGFEIEENSIITGYFKTNALRNGYEFLAPSIASKATLSLASLTADRVYTLPDKNGTYAMTNDLTSFITLASITATAPIVYTAGVISITQATTSTDGYLNSTDWNIFNNKLSTTTATATYVPYTGATTDVDLGVRTIKSSNFITPTSGKFTTSNGGGSIFLDDGGNANNVVITNDGNLYASSYFYLQKNVTGYNNTAYVVTNDTSTNTVKGQILLGVYSSNVAAYKSLILIDSDKVSLTYKTVSVNLTLTGFNFVGGPIIANSQKITLLSNGTISTDAVNFGQLSTKQNTITLTTTGASGAATFITNTLNIPTYTLAGLGGQASNANLTSLSGLTFASTSFVKMTAAGTFALDTNTYLTANQSITLSGDISGTGTNAITTTIGSNKVTLAMMSQIPTATFLGRTTAATGNVETLTVAQVKTLLNLVGNNNGDVTLAGQNYLTIAAQVITANAIDLSGTHVTGILAASRFPALTGDVTTTAGSLTTTISNTVVTGKLLTGYVSGSGVISATDTILQAIQKLNGNITALVTGVTSVAGTTNRITSTGGANPVIDISASYVGQSSITTLGTITTGVWNGTSITTAYTDAKIKTVVGTTNAIVITGTLTDPIFNIGSNVVTLTGAQALSNKTGLISQWTNDSSYLTTTLASSTYLPLTGGTLSGNLNGVTPSELFNLSGSTSNIQNQINNINLGISVKLSAKILLTSNVNIASPGATLDSITMVSGYRVVLNGQTTGSQNGVYIWNGAASPMTRATDCSTGGTGSTGVLGMTITIEEGTNGDQIWLLSTNAPITIGSTVLTFIKSSNTTYTGSNGITLTGNNFILDTTFFSGNATISSLGVITIGANKVSNTMLVNSSITIGSTNIALGATSTTLTGLTSITSTSFIGALTGNSTTATTLQTARTINGVSFDGSGNITITANITNALTVDNLSLQLNTGTTFDGSVARTISVKALGITNAMLANSSILLGGQTLTLGAVATTTLTGLTSVTSTTFVGALTGNASSATILQTARAINGVSFNGSADITVTAAAGTLTGTSLNATVVGSSLTSVGVLTGGSTGAGFTIALTTSTITGKLTEVNGGTNQTTYTTGDLLYASATNTLSKLAATTNGYVLTLVSGKPAWTVNAGGGGTVTSVSVITANGFSGTVATSTTTPAITIGTTVTGLLKGNGTAISAAIANTDYQSPSANLTSLSALTYSTPALVKMTGANTFGLETNINNITNVGTIGITIDGAGSVLTAGFQKNIIIPYDCIITEWYIISDVVGNIVMDVWKNTVIPTVANTITGSEKPTLIAQQTNNDTNLTTWNTSVTKGDIIGFNIDSVSTIKNVTLVLKVTKTTINIISNQRVLTITSSALPTINTDLYDAIDITALATDITSMTTNLTGVGSNFQRLTFRFKDNGIARAINWGSSFASRGATLPTTTVIGKITTVGFIYNSTTGIWGCVAYSQE